MSYCPDNYDMWKAHDQRQTEWLNSRPKCVNCGESLQGEFAYNIHGDLWCKSCLDEEFRVSID